MRNGKSQFTLVRMEKGDHKGFFFHYDTQPKPTHLRQYRHPGDRELEIIMDDKKRKEQTLLLLCVKCKLFN